MVCRYLRKLRRSHMNNWVILTALIIVTWLSGWVPSIALFILHRRDKPVSPPFLCVPCQRAIACARCVTYMEKLKWRVRPLFFCFSILGLTRIGGLESVVLFCFLFTLILVSVTDLWSKLIPDVITYSAGSLFVFLRFFIHSYPVFNYILTAIISMGVLFLLGWLTNGIGGGDAKLLAVCSLVLGWPYTILAFWFGTVSALLYVGLRMFVRPITKNEAIPFGPHLSVGCYISYVWGEWIFQFYVRAFSLS